MNIYSSNDTLVLSVVVDDNSYRNRQVMGDHSLTLHFALAEHVEIPIGSYVMYQNTRYTLERPENMTMKHSRNFEYTVVFEAYQARAQRWMIRNTVDGRVKFPLTATPREHLQQFVDNMNRRDTGWTVGTCIDAAAKLVSYDHTHCLEALQLIADAFETEYEIAGKTVSLHKVEYNRDEPIELSYGKGNGFKSGIGRSNSDTMPVEVLFVQGGTQNIDPSVYGNTELLLPAGQTIRYDGVHFEDEAGYDSTSARQYIASSDGLSIQRNDKALSSYYEESLDCSDIYPNRIGKVGQVITVDADNYLYDFTDKNELSNPCPNYSDYQIDGEKMTVIFQSGMLAGREFEVNYYNAAVTEKGQTKLAKRFEIVPQEIDGQTMPNSTFKPSANDTYIVYHCTLPSSYIRSDASKSGASWDMFRAAVRYMYEHEDAHFTFTGSLDGIWAKQDWENIGGKIILGGCVQFTDASFQPDPVIVRITGIKDYINNPHSPEITLSNEPVRGNFASEIKQLQSEEVVVEEVRRQTQQFTRRRFRDAQETSRMLEQALIDGYTQSISPAAARMLQLLVGDESMQYRFVNSHTSAVPTIVTPVFSYNAATGVFSITGNYFLQHLTLGVDMSSTHAASEYMWWSVQAYTSAVLDDPDKRYYVYLKCSRTSGTSAVYILSETAIGMTAVTGYYHFLVGILNSEYDKSRSFTSLYGFTEIAGARITTDKIVSSDGNTYFDLAQGEIGGKITFAQGTSGLQNIQEWSSFYTGLQSELQNIQDQLDGVVETWYYSGEPTLNNLPASQWATDTEREKHVGDLYYDKDTGKAYRFMHDSDAQTYIWVALADADIARALATAAAAQDTADSKRRVFVAQPTNAQPYDVGDMWVNATYGNLYSNDVLRCITAKAAGATFNIAHWQLASKYTDDTAVLALADKLNDDDTFTVVEKRAVRDTLKQLSNNESSYAVLYAVTAEETTMGNDWDTETDTTSIFYGWKRSNLHTHNSATVVRITVKAYSACQMTVKIGSRAEGNYDYTLLGKLDNTGIVNETGTIDASKVAADTKGARQGNVVQHTFTLQAGTHTFEIAYRKDISTSTQPDNGYYYIQYFPINKGTLYTALESCRAAGLTDRMDSIITAANTLFQYASGAGSVWVDEDTELADGVSFRNTLVGYCSTVLSLIAVAAEEVASTKAVSAEDSAKNNIAQNLGYASWEDMVDKATHEQTIIKGGYLRSTLIDVINLVVQNITSKDGKFRTLEDGTVKAVDGEFAGKVIASSGEIGGFSISDGLQAQDDAGNSVRLNSSSIYFDADKLGSLSTGTGYVKVGAGAIDPTWGSYVGCLSCVIDNASRLGADTNIGIYIRIDGSNSVNNALYVEKGVFAGLRPKTRVISTDVTLSKMWYNLVFITQRTEAERKTITLPESPEEGQTYELLNVNGSYFTLNGNGKTIWVVYNAASGTSVNLGGTRGCWRLIYANTYWYALLYNYQS